MKKQPDKLVMISLPPDCPACGDPLDFPWLLLWRPEGETYDGICATCAEVLLKSAVRHFYASTGKDTVS